MSNSPLAYRVVAWDQLFETRGSRRRSGPLAKVTLSTALDGWTTRRILSHPQGAAIYGVWILILQIAAKGPRRGALVEQGLPLTADDLALLTQVPAELCTLALEVLSSSRVNLLEQVPVELALTPPPVERPLASNNRNAHTDKSTAEPQSPSPTAIQGGFTAVKHPFTGLPMPLPPRAQSAEPPQQGENLRPPLRGPAPATPLPRPPIPSAAG